MSFLSDNKLLFGAVGIAVSSAALGYFLSRGFNSDNSDRWENMKLTAKGDVVTNYVLNYGIREPAPLAKLREVTMNQPKWSMICSADEAQLMRLLIKLIGAKKVMEVGVYTGYNALSMAIALPPDGKVVACDITDEYLKELNSLQYFKEAGVESKLDFQLQPATKTLDELLAAGEAGTFQLVFIDADKTGYDEYYEKSLKLLCKGGLIVLDNVLQGNRVANPQDIESNEDVRAIHTINLKIQKDARVEMSMLLFSDGVTVAMKL